MASHAGTLNTSIRADKFAALPGRTSGLGIAFHQTDFAFFGRTDGNVSGARTSAGGGGAKASPVARTGEQDQDIGLGSIWFEKFHALPKTEIAFGNILAQEDKDYELYNACRDATATITAITNNAQPGVELPGVSAPLDVPPGSSVKDASSTSNSGGTGLGTIVKAKVRALVDGLPTFNTTIDFSTTKNTVVLRVSGTRVVLLPFEFETPVEEELAFLTDVIEAVDGNEQRISVRKQPRQSFRLRYALSGNDRQRMQVLLMDWMDNVFGVPLWHEMLRLTAAVSAGATVYPVSGADQVDFRVGGLGVVITDANTFDVLNIVAVSATQITVADQSVNAYPAGTPIMPVRTAVLSRPVSAKRALNNLEEFIAEFRVTDNDTGAPAGSTTAWNPNTYNGKVLLDECNVAPDMDQRYIRRVHVLDNQTGLVSVRSPWDRGRRVSQKGFVARSRQQILNLKKLLLALRGNQVSFYLPTFFDDVTVKADLSLGAATMDIQNIEYTRFVNSRAPKNVLRITFSDGTSLVRVVQSSTKVDATTERLTLDTTWPANRTVSEIVRVEFFELVRFDTNRFRLTYPRAGLAEVVAPVRTVLA